MSNKLPDVDAYIAKSAPFAQPILKKIRTVVHKACPEIEEAIKWGTPTFVQQGIVEGMAAFKEHVSLVFWKGGLMTDPEGLFSDLGDKKMYTVKLKFVANLPANKVLTAYLQEAVELDKQGAKTSASRRGKAKREATREKRLTTAIEWMAEGKPRNWKYTKKLS